MERTVLNLLDQAKDNHPDSIYLCQKTENGWEPTTYSRVDELSEKFASGLIDLDLQKNARIALLAEGRTDWVISEFGILKAACIAVPLSINLLPREILYRLNHSEASLILVSQNTLPKIGHIWAKVKNEGCRIVYLDQEDHNLKRMCGEYELDLKKDIVLVSDLVEQGSMSLDNNREELKRRREDLSEDDIVTISYTSGTTGDPKGIMLSHLNYYANSYGAYNYFQIPFRLKTLIILPLDHSFAHTVGIYISLLCRLSIYFVDSRGGQMQALKNIPRNLQEVKPDILLTVPALTRNFMKKIDKSVRDKGALAWRIFQTGMRSGIQLNRNKSGLNFRSLFLWPAYKLADIMVFKKVRQIFGGRLWFCVSGGALLGISQQEYFYALGIPVYQGYGLTEAAPIVSSNCEHSHKLGTSGRLIPNVECSICRSDGTPAPWGERGQIWVRGENVMEGYYKNDQATREAIRDGWLITGDIGYLDEDGFLVVVGREKALLISEDGEKYSPESIEEAIKSCSEFVYQVLIYNDHRRYTVALITLEMDNIRRYALKHGIYSSEKMLKRIEESFYCFQDTQTFGDIFPSKWIPSIFRIIEEPFSEQNKMINSTLKMVRPRILETYGQEIEDMYSEEGSSIYCQKNIRAVQNILINSGCMEKSKDLAE